MLAGLRHPLSGWHDGELQQPQYITIAGDAVVVIDPANALSAALIHRMGWSAARGEHVYSIGRDPQAEEEVLRRYRLVRPWEQ